MLSILNILKKHHQTQKSKSGGLKSPDSGLDFIGQRTDRLSHDDGEAAQSTVSNVSIAQLADKNLSSERLERVKELYDQLLDCAKKLYNPEFAFSADFKSGFLAAIEKALDFFSSGSRELLQLSLADYRNKEDSLYCHAVNVMIISLELGTGLGYNRQQLLELGVASLLHDIGSIKYLELINKEGNLSDEELRKVKEHPFSGLEILNKMGGEFMAGTVQVISQEHERLDGSGYPKGLRDDQINEYAQIVGLVDVYEAMTHLRPYRVKFSPPKAMNAILSKKNGFSTKILKIFLEKIGIFPVGSMVRLNTKEIGVVYKENQGLPLRPKVEVRLDENGNKLVSPKQIDLATNLLVCIEECLDVSGEKAGL